MRLNPKLPLSDSFQARLAAQAILRNHFDMKRAVAELRPDIRQWRAFGRRLLAEPAVQHKMEIIMDKGDRNAQKFIGTLWEWLERLDASTKTGVVPTRSEMEAGLTAARILAKIYLAVTKSESSPPSGSLLILEGLDSQGIQNLAGEALGAATRKMN